MHTRKLNISINDSCGFTIVELLIATVIFSMVLLLVTTGVLEITKVYYKGVTDSNTQTVATNIIDTVAQAIQFDGGAVQTTPASAPPGSSYVFCVGDQQFSYYPGYQLVSGTLGQDETNHSIVENTAAGCTPQNMTGSVQGRELMGQDMRLSNISVTCALPSGICNDVPGAILAYKVQVRVVFGGDDLLFSPTLSQQGASNATQAAAPDAECSGSSSDEDQFCSRSDLSTIVVKRVQ